MWLVLLILITLGINFCHLSYSNDNEYAVIKLQCYFESFGNDGFGCRTVNLTSNSRRTFIKSILRLSTTNSKSKSKATNNDVNTFYSYNGNITFIPKQIGEHFPNLNNFIITKTGLKYIEWRDFKHMGHLEMIKLNENKIEAISQCAFHYLENLKSINLDGNRIQILPLKLLTNLPNLTEFSANDNDITHLMTEMFKENQNLKTLLMNRNKIEVIEIDFHGWNIDRVEFKNNTCINMKYICCAHVIFKNFTEHIKKNCGGPDFC
ncbi:hypothetical protein PVAND_008620 [Polypedilum vanderplanki]|uniref:Uncharacterized protein n=1 Tax=Polypedilum vanderplanki TaxID=319348 RepID=A0A9J6CAV4_POLVA|nr:hypothetical protein PVAND_008620 [Polypedilum vanderplanki]